MQQPAFAARFQGGTFAGQKTDGSFGLVTYAPGVIIPGYGPPDPYNTANADGALGGNPPASAFFAADPDPPSPSEAGWKDTFVVSPGRVNRVLARWAPTETELDDVAPGENKFTFDPTAAPGYLWHCHILDHEDNEMMRPYTPVR